ncbi:ABC transporter [Nitzschia inconspicua]|uniref:ABC transporter n=1 Tax=Nitzschia inconspicua TaxID=303405 RepID=A0A9K3Q5Y6_9STRA|nr:ABC transporter [Nitzschia inconspicua]
MSRPPGCNNEPCLRAVCQADSRCCAESYNAACVTIARTLQGSVCAPQTTPQLEGQEEELLPIITTGAPTRAPLPQENDNPLSGHAQSFNNKNNCFQTSSTPGCDDEVCLGLICLEQPSCCTENFNYQCVESARRNGLTCQTPSRYQNNNCLDVNPFGGCTNSECEAQVCQQRPECCNRGNLVGEWNSECVDTARRVCDLTGKNTCFQVMQTPGCTDSLCADVVCQDDDFCCERQWDSSCVEAAIQNSNEYCKQDWPPQENSCFEADPFQRPGCSDDGSQCEVLVCALRPECCDTSYNEECVRLALKHCDLPAPKNHCYRSTGIPGCTDSLCLETVCNIDETCCSVGYTNECVNIARKNARACRPPDLGNTCFQESPFGGCLDKRCEQMVCEINSGCCNGDEAGQWNKLCVRAAEELCRPDIVKRPNGNCPVGMTCGTDAMANCTELAAQYRDVFELGDVYGGIYCGDGSDKIQNCPQGMYCPDPVTMLPCPAGFFCPYKTALPTIRCRKCEEGATELTQDLYGYIILSIILFFVAIYVTHGLLKRYNKRLADRIHYFEKRVFVDKLQGTMKKAHSILEQSQQQKQMLEKLRPKLELISRRLARLEKANPKSPGHVRKNSNGSSPGHVRSNSWGSKPNHVRKNSWGNKTGHVRKNSWGAQAPGGHVRKNSSSNGLDFVGDDIRFDARRVFDILDADASGDVTFEELNVIMGFNEVELKEFMRRMNEMAGLTSDTGTVSRPVFVKYFLQALLETTKLTISFEEAANLFDEMSGSTDEKPVDEINMNKFYTSSMSDFLSDTQIFELIRGFKAIKASVAPIETPTAGGLRNSVSGLFSPEFRKSVVLQRETSIPRPTAAQMRRCITVSTVPNRRQSIKAMMSARKLRSNKSLTDDVESVQELFGRRNSMMSQGSTTNQRGPIVVQSTVTREEFVEHYPQLLTDIMLFDEEDDDVSEMQHEVLGIDICFKNLSLSVKLGNKQSAKVVDGVTGRIRAKTMTGILGGSGAGKTSLLNALCGRAYYGETRGTILVNGHEARIEDFKDSVGFVPQDDIVYAELTVRENLIFSGKFRLPKGTSDEEIEELADETLASLGLSRVADSPVGDIRRRGVSGGERKRVSIGLELMALPSILFLDEPTSGLDASSALLVMKSLKHLVEKDGVTVVSVIHQPRKFIYDLFDSLILLGVGGRMVYHGPTGNAESYFARLNYSLPQGESMADWLIDISSGRLEPDNHVAETKSDESFRVRNGKSKRHLALPSLRTVVSKDDGDKPNSLLRPKPSLPRHEVWDSSKDAIPNGEVWSGGMSDNDAAIGKLWANMATSSDHSPSTKEDDATSGTTPLKESSDDSDQADSMSVGSNGLVRKISFDGPRTPGSSVDEKEEFDSVDTPISRRSTSRLAAAGRVVTDGNCVGAKGVTTGKVVQAMEEAKERRAWLCEEWSRYFEKLTNEEKAEYEPPAQYDLPHRIEEPSVWSQFRNQFRRQLIVGWRNRFSKTIDFTVIVLAVITITALDGVTTVSVDNNPDIPFGSMVRPLKEELGSMFEQLFSYAIPYQIQYPLKVGIILSVLLGLTATKIVTSKRLEFFREAGSGYNLNAYFGAISILSTLEHSIQVIIAAFFASWIRNPIASNASYYIHFLLLAWVTVGWALFIPMVVPADSVTLVAGFFFAFCGLMFSGAFAPITYQEIYEEGGFKEVFAGWISPTRFFYEALTVGEYRCLPEQSGYTIEESSVNRRANSTMTIVLGYAGHDYGAVRWSCNGWYWSVVPVLLIGLTIRYLAVGAMHAMYRGQQTKKPLFNEMRKKKRVAIAVTFYCLGFAVLFTLTTWLFIRDQPFAEPEPPSKAELLNRFGFFD